MSNGDRLIVDAATKLLQDLADPQTINNSQNDEWQPGLWNALEESGLTLTWVPEELGGAGADLADGFQIIRLSGEFALPLPLAETLLAGWLLAHGGLQVPGGRLTIAPATPDRSLELNANNQLSGEAEHVPFARGADYVVSIARREQQTFVVCIETAACQATAYNNLAGEPRDRLIFDHTPVTIIAETDLDETALQQMGAAVRAMQIAGALQKVLDLCVSYAGERVAFGRPISKFQVIQHNLARLAGEAAAALAAAGSAAYALEENSVTNNNATLDDIFFEVAAAKIRAGEAAGEGAAIAHQLHGAIGFTQEHLLHRFTHRLWSWRDDFGSEAVWSLQLGQKIAAAGADQLWPTVTAV